MWRCVLIVIVFASAGRAGNAQTSDPVYRQVDSFIQDYMQLSRLGPGYSREMSPEIIGQFKALYERNAFLYWDLYKSATDSALPQLPVNEYVGLAMKLYRQRQPLLDYPAVKIRIRKDRATALVYLKKINQVVTDDDKPLGKNHMNLLVNVSLEKDRPYIRNIFEDKHLPPVRSISAGFNYLVWSTAVSALVYHTSVSIGGNEHYSAIDITSGTSVQAGGMVEIRMDNDTRHGLSFNTGMYYSIIPLSSSMADYSKSYPDTLGKGTANPLACTTFERTPEVWEKIEFKKLEIPLLLKSYLSNWIYLKSGTCLSVVTATSEVSYVLSRTGGGWVTNLSTQERYYLDKDHELDQSVYGYYRNSTFRFSKEKFLTRMALSIHLAVGFEKQVRHFGFELEPNISIGMNPLSTRILANSYPLNDVNAFHPILTSANMPAVEVAYGFRFLVSYLFVN